MSVSGVLEERVQGGATRWTRGALRGAEGGHCEVALNSAQKTPTTNQVPGSNFRPTRSNCRRLGRKRAGSVGLIGPWKEAPPPSEDKLFWHKCLELQCYIHPLASILQRLRSGKFTQRLSSFQQGVAIQRIQKIMATLQNPNMGGRFITNIRKLEKMLKSWFPHVNATSSQVDNNVTKRRKCYSTSSWSQEVTQVNAVSSSTDCLRKPVHPIDTPLHSGLQALPPVSITSPCLERLLQAEESIVTPVSGGGDRRRVMAVTEGR